MNIRFLSITFLLLPIATWAQETSKSFTLKQCIEYAATNNAQSKNASLDEYIATSKVWEYIGTGLPQISASGGVQHADPLRRIYGVGNGQYNFLANAVVPNGEVFAVPNFFQLPNTVDASVSLSQLVFSSSYFYGLKAAKTYQELSRVSRQNTLVQITENVTKAYYMALVNAERQKLFDINLARLDSLLKQTDALYKGGFAEKIDVDRLQVTYNNLQTERDKFVNLLVMSNLMLKFQMGMPIDQELLLADRLDGIQLDSSSVAGKADYTKRTEYKMLQTQLKLEKLNYKANLYSAIPSLGFTANVGTFTQSPKLDFLDRKHVFYHYGTYTLGVNMPLFTGFSRNRKIQQTKLAYQKTENNIEQFENAVNLQAKTSELSLLNSLKSLQVQRRNMDLAKEVVRVSQVKYKSGVGSNIEVINAESSLKEAQVNYYNAVYDALISKVDYDKALGNLQ